MNKIILCLLAVTLCLACLTTYKVYSVPSNALGATPSYQITHWTGGGSFGGDLAVGGDLTVTGTTTVSGNVSGVPKTLSQTMSSSATTTACTFLNSSGASRTIVSLTVVDTGSAASLGAINWQAGTSTASGANGSSAIAFTKAINTTITRLSGTDVIVPTSTTMGSSGALYPWKNGEYLNFISSTTVNSGVCRFIYY